MPELNWREKRSYTMRHTLEKTRWHLVKYAPLYTFLAAYFLTTVFGNALYLTPFGRDLPAMSIKDFDWRRFHVDFGWEFWFLLLIPFAVVPSISIATRRVFRPIVAKSAWLLPEIPVAVYVMILFGLYAFVTYRMYQADAVQKLIGAKDFVEAVNNRYEIIASLGTKARICLMSLLVFLTVYSSVKSSRHGRWWAPIAAFNIIAMIGLLTALNMKWPMVLFIFTIGIQTFITARSWPFVKSGAIIAAGIAAYLIISVILLNLVHAMPISGLERAKLPAYKMTFQIGASIFDSEPLQRTDAVVKTAALRTPQLLAVTVNRMAMAVPFYWTIFSNRTCGNLFDSILPVVKCQPSYVAYSMMFPNDGFAGRGTAPAAFHIYEYARGHWVGAAAALLLGSVLLGAFMGLWQVNQENDLLVAIFVMGTPVGYFLSQLPFEAVIFYDHGIAWWGIMVIFIATPLAIWRRMAGLSQRESLGCPANSKL